MADKITITIENEPPNRAIDGVYPIEVPLTNRDLHSIKDISGVRTAEIEEALAAGDNDVVVAFAFIGLRRNGKAVPVDALWDMPAGRIQVELPDAQEDEADADPPPQHGEPASAAVTPITSGASSKQPSENQGNGPSSTGAPISDIGQGFA